MTQNPRVVYTDERATPKQYIFQFIILCSCVLTQDEDIKLHILFIVELELPPFVFVNFALKNWLQEEVIPNYISQLLCCRIGARGGFFYVLR